MCLNYRPISKLYVISQVLEKVVCNNVYKILLHSFCPYLHGFLKRRFTVSNLALLNSFLTNAMDSGLQVDVIYIDYSKAFHTIDHEPLFLKFVDFGICGDVLWPFSSYIDCRSQAVVVSNHISSWVKFPSGVPQGSLLGPVPTTCDFVTDTLTLKICLPTWRHETKRWLCTLTRTDLNRTVGSTTWT